MHIHTPGICGPFLWADTGIALLRIYTTIRRGVAQKIVRVAVS